MRKLILALCASTFSLAWADETDVIVEEPKRLCTVVDKGAVGDATGEATSILKHTITGDEQVIVVLRVAESSLCSSHAAVGIIQVNKRIRADGLLTEDPYIQSDETAESGDEVIAVLHEVPLENGKVCAIHGSLEVTLEQCRLE